MAMSGEDLERTGILTTIMNKREDDETVLERVEELEEKLEYIGIDSSKKDKILEMIEKIKDDKEISTQEKKLDELIEYMMD